MISPLLVCVITVAATGAFPSLSNTNDVCFNAKSSEGLQFPLPDPTSLSSSVGHGIHCLKTLELEDKQHNGPVYQMHRKHCKHVIKSVLNFMLHNPNYSVSKLVCDDLLDFASEESDNFDERSKEQRIQVLKSYCISCDVQHTTTYDEKYEESLLAKLITTPSGSFDPDKFWLLAGFNLGKLLMRQHFHPETLSVAERNYLAQWDSPFNTRMSALGVSCLQGNPIERIQKILKEKD